MTKFKYWYGIPGNPKTYFSKVYTLEEIETGEQYLLVKRSKFKIISRDQFTGLKDKNGVDIFENDILSFIFDGEVFTTGPVKWRTDVSLWAIDIGIGLTSIEPEDLWVQEAGYEIIGNIHTNSELLKGYKMKECTLREAIELCLKNGGCFYKKDVPSVQYTPETDDEFTVDDILMKWIYEPSQKSAFQEWEERQPRTHHLFDEQVSLARKEGWNAFANKLLEWIEKIGKPAEVNVVGIIQQIKEMKEK